MKKILASIVIALLLTSCLLDFSPDYIPYNTIVHRPLRAGVYEARTYTTRYVLTIERGEHYLGSPCTLQLYSMIGSPSVSTPYVTFTGEYRHGKDYTDYNYYFDYPYSWDRKYHVDELVFNTRTGSPDYRPSEASGTIAILYDHQTAGEELEDGSYRQALFPRMDTIVHFEKSPYVYDEYPELLDGVGPFIMTEVL